jgi:hypothetical protein
MATYVNDLRLKEIATGDEAGTWGTSTNTNLELIGEALGYGTQDCFSSDADATTTVADGATDPARAMYFKVTSSATLSAGRTLTIAPNTISRVMFIENATTGSQVITISQGTGGNVAIANGKTAVVYLDGAGSGAAIVDAMALVDPGVTDTLAEVLVAGNTTGGTDINFGDNDKAVFGGGNDLQLYHDGSNSYIDENGVGNLFIRSVNGASARIYSGGTASSNLRLLANSGGEITLYHSGSAKIATTNTGIDVTGVITTDGMTTSADINFGDNDKAIFGAGSDLQIYHDGTHSVIDDTGTGNLILQSNGAQVSLQSTTEYYLTAANNGAVTAYYDGSAKLQTTSTGIDVTGTITFDGGTTSADINFGDNDKAIFGAGSDLQIYHDGSHSYIVDAGTGNMYLSTNGNGIVMQASLSETMFSALPNGSVRLYHDNSQKLETTSTGIDLTGSVTADGGTFDGAVLMNSSNELQFFNTNYGIRASTGLEIKTGDFTRFLEGSTEHMRIASGGNVGIGTTPSNAKLEVVASSGEVFRADASGGAYRIVANQTGVLMNGTVGIGTSTPSSYDSRANNLVVGDSGDAGITIFSGASNDARLQFAPSGDTGLNNGLIGYDNANDKMSFATAGTDRMQIESDGNLRVYDSIDNLTGTLTLNGRTTGQIRFESGGSLKMLMDSAGHLGIGVSSVSAPLHVSKSINNYVARFENSDASNPYTVWIREPASASAGYPLLSISNNAGTDTYLRVDSSSGNVGIGLNNPTAPLTVNGNSNGLLAEFGGNNSVSTRRLQLNEYVVSGINNSGFEFNAPGAGGFAAISFATLSNECMRITSAGNVGIGTASPSSALHVQDTNSIVYSEGTGGYGSFYAKGSGTNAAYLFMGNGGGEKGRIQTEDDGTIVFSNTTSATPRMRIDSSGNVGINNTNPTAPLHANGASQYGSAAKFQNDGSATGWARTDWINDQASGSGIIYRDENGTFSFRNDNSSGSSMVTDIIAGGSTSGVTRFFRNSSNESMQIDSSGNLLVGTSTTAAGNEGMVYFNGSSLRVTRDSDEPLNLDRLTSDGTIAAFKKDGSTVGSVFSYNGFLGIGSTSGNDAYLLLGSDFVAPATSTGTARDGAIDIGASGRRFKDIYATNGTIQTSDRNEKQDIEELSDAEQRVAVACKGLLRKYRWKSAVEEKGDDARIHFGIIAQDLQDAFTAEGLDAGRYGMFINSTWTDEETGEERSRMGVRYSELLAFIISAI